jgi:hypothetical protein
VELVDEGTGTLKYLVVETSMDPYVADDLHTLLEEVMVLADTKVWLITRDHDPIPVHVECTSPEDDEGDCEDLDYEVTLVDGGELIERIEYDPDGQTGHETLTHVQHVNGF